MAPLVRTVHRHQLLSQHKFQLQGPPSCQRVAPQGTAPEQVSGSPGSQQVELSVLSRVHSEPAPPSLLLVAAKAAPPRPGASLSRGTRLWNSNPFLISSRDFCCVIELHAGRTAGLVSYPELISKRAGGQ